MELCVVIVPRRTQCEEVLRRFRHCVTKHLYLEVSKRGMKGHRHGCCCCWFCARAQRKGGRRYTCMQTHTHNARTHTHTVIRVRLRGCDTHSLALSRVSLTESLPPFHHHPPASALIIITDISHDLSQSVSQHPAAASVYGTQQQANKQSKILKKLDSCLCVRMTSTSAPAGSGPSVTQHSALSAESTVSPLSDH